VIALIGLIFFAGCIMSEYREKAEKLITYLGGRDNIESAFNCMTRLRIKVRSEEPVDETGLKAATDVMELVHDRENAYEIVVGPGKCRKYADAFHDAGIGSAVSNEAGFHREWKNQRKSSRIKSALKTVGDIFVPLIPGIVTAGLCAGFAALIAQLVPDYADKDFWNLLYQFLTLIQTAFMTYITAWAGYRAAERFGGTPIIGGMLGMITSLDGINSIAEILGLANSETPLSSILHSGKGGVLAVIFGVLIMSYVEKWIRARMPESVDMIFTPFLTLILCVIPYVLIIMPLFGFVSSGIAWAFGEICMSESIFVRVLVGYVSAFLFLPLVASGMHHGLIALYTVQLEELGYVTLYPAFAMAGAGQVGAALALRKKAKRAGNSELCSVINGALPAGLLGVGEPLIYGVTLPLGKPFITAGLGAGFGGAFVMAMEVASTTWGPSGLLGIFVMTGGPGGALKSVIFYVIGLIISYVCSYLITYFTIHESDLKSGGAVSAQIPDRNSRRNVKHGDTLSVRRGSTVTSPVNGKVYPMEDIPDEVFAAGVLGPCIGVMPEKGIFYAPCDGTVSSVADTGHAVTFTTKDGRSIMLHIGIDTVKLNGRGLDVRVKEGDTITKDRIIMKADLKLIRNEGYSPMAIIVQLEESE